MNESCNRFYILSFAQITNYSWGFSKYKNILYRVIKFVCPVFPRCPQWGWGQPNFQYGVPTWLPTSYAWKCDNLNFSITFRFLILGTWEILFSRQLNKTKSIVCSLLWNNFWTYLIMIITGYFNLLPSKIFQQYKAYWYTSFFLHLSFFL